MSIGKRPDGYNHMTEVERECGGQRPPDGYGTMTASEKRFAGTKMRKPDEFSRMTEREQDRLVDDARRKSDGFWPW